MGGFAHRRDHDRRNDRGGDQMETPAPREEPFPLRPLGGPFFREVWDETPRARNRSQASQNGALHVGDASPMWLERSILPFNRRT
jgi:hypothetical protein